MSYEDDDCGGDCGRCARCRDRELVEERRSYDRMMEDLQIEEGQWRVERDDAKEPTDG